MMSAVASLITTQNLFISVHDAVLFAGRSINESEALPPAPSPAPSSSGSATQTTLPYAAPGTDGTHIPEAPCSRGDGASEIDCSPSGDAQECDQ